MKKGQAAMEFLMTYGWAILVVIAAIAALAYFGVLDPARLLPERCQSAAGMDCVDKASVSTTQLDFVLRNNIGFDANITGLSSTVCSSTTYASAGTTGSYTDLNSTEVAVNNNQVVRLRVACVAGDGLSSGDKFEDTVTVSYENIETGLSHSLPVDIRGRVG